MQPTNVNQRTQGSAAPPEVRSVCFLRHPDVAYLFLVRSMRAAFCLTIIVLSETIAHAGKPQPSATPAHVTFTPADARRVSAYTPSPHYPSTGRVILRGSGRFRLYVSLQTGSVTSTQIEQSTGYQILDATAVDTFKRWRFKPDVLRAYLNLHSGSDTVVVRVPVTFGPRSDLTRR